jgi:Asp/Glu/hydantoin racemase
MSGKRLGLVHTSAALIPVFARLCEAKLPGVEVFNIVDDSLVPGIMAAGRLTSAISQRVAKYLKTAEEAGAQHILVTCSSIGPAVEAAAPSIGVPVLRVDQPMADEAVNAGQRIGIVATLRTTLNPTADLLQRRARHAGKQIQLTSWLCDGAFDALVGGDVARHDATVAAALKELSQQVDVVVLAQASMARVVDTRTASDSRVPILTSPALAVDHLAMLL